MSNLLITKEILDQFFDSEAILLNKGHRREVFMFRGLIVKRVYRGYHRAVDLNLHEFHNYQKIAANIPKTMLENFQAIYGVIETDSGVHLISEAVLDENGLPCVSMAEYGPIMDNNFWKQLDTLVQFLAGIDTCLTDLHGKNVLIRKRENQLIPVIVDYKTMGNDFSPWQIDLFFSIGRACKMYRKYKRMKKEFFPTEKLGQYKE